MGQRLFILFKKYLLFKIVFINAFNPMFRYVLEANISAQLS